MGHFCEEARRGFDAERCEEEGDRRGARHPRGMRHPGDAAHLEGGLEVEKWRGGSEVRGTRCVALCVASVRKQAATNKELRFDLDFKSFLRGRIVPKVECLDFHVSPLASCLSHPGENSGANLKSISHRCHSILVEFV